MDRITDFSPLLKTTPRPIAIHDLYLHPLAEIPVNGGPVLHMLRADSPLFQGFGEIYFSLVEAGAVKAWKRHKRQTQFFAVPSGLVQVVVFDSRHDSPSQGGLAQVLLGRPGYYALLRIPPGLWYGFTSREGAVLANCADIPHDPQESDRLPADTPTIPFQWII